MKGPSTIRSSADGPPPLEIEGRRFGAAAERLAAAAAVLLGWRPDEFWNATPGELATALSLLSAQADGPDQDVIAALRRRHPDEKADHGR